MTRDEWLRAFCERLGVDPPTAEEEEPLLELAAIAAHSSERPAAPLACWAAGRGPVLPRSTNSAAITVSLSPVFPSRIWSSSCAQAVRPHSALGICRVVSGGERVAV